MAANRQFGFFPSRKQVSVGRRVFLAVVLSQLFSIALIFGWYFYVLRSELDSLTRQRAQETVLQSIAAIEDYFKPAEMAVEAGQLLLSDHILGPDNPDPLERYFFGQLRLRPLLDGSLCWQSGRRILLRHAQQREGRRRYPHQGNTEWSPRPRGRADMAGARLRALSKVSAIPRTPMIREHAAGIAPRLNGAVAPGPSPTSSSARANPGSRSPQPLSGKTARLKLCSELISR